MKIFMACCAMLALASSATAAEGLPSASRMAAMGLGGAQIATDAEAMSVRGMGYSPSSAKAYGGSFAIVGSIGPGGLAAAGSVNVYKADGKHFATGSNFSEAGKTVTHKVVKNIGGMKFSVKKVHSVHVFAGGSSTAKAF